MFHVRRGDILLDTNRGVKSYIPFSRWVETSSLVLRENNISNIFLMTDSSSVIDEIGNYWRRPRYNSTEGGMGQHIPSNDPIFETTVIMASFELASRCSVFVALRQPIEGIHD